MRWLTAGAFVVLVAGILLVGFLGPPPAQAGGPLVVGGTIFGGVVDGQAFVWSTAAEIQYRTDGGPLGRLTNAEANTRVVAMFDVWETVTTAAIGFNRAGPLLSTGAFTDGDVSTVEEFNAVDASCNSGPGGQNPIIYDADGSIFDTLFGSGTTVIGFAGPCFVNSLGNITSAHAALNGKFIDNDPANGELTDDEFDAAFIHEFGHFAGLDHSQINVNCLSGCTVDDQEGLPTMFPFLLGDFMKTLATDDIAWISNLYPSGTFSTSFGTISGTILFSDGVTHAQGVNVIARQEDNAATPEVESRRIAVSVVSGFLFTGNPGQSVTGTNDAGSIFGSRDPLRIGTFEIPVPPGNYTVEVESVFSTFTGGSSVGPLGKERPTGAEEQFPLPGPAEFWNVGESSTDVTTASDPVSVTEGVTTANIDIILNGTPPRFDAFESASLLWRQPAPAWLRQRWQAALGVGA